MKNFIGYGPHTAQEAVAAFVAAAGAYGALVPKNLDLTEVVAAIEKKDTGRLVDTIQQAQSLACKMGHYQDGDPCPEPIQASFTPGSCKSIIKYTLAFGSCGRTRVVLMTSSAWYHVAVEWDETISSYHGNEVITAEGAEQHPRVVAMREALGIPTRTDTVATESKY